MIRAHLSYLNYVLRHKWYVFRECQRVGITWRGIVHDFSKFSRAEWEPYVCTFYNPDGSKRDVRDATGHYDPTTLGKAFDVAWLHHIQHNPHHWQHWVLLEDSGAVKPLDMPSVYIWEMIADWYGAGRAIHGAPLRCESSIYHYEELRSWYLANRDKMQMHEHTRRRVEFWIGLPPDDWTYQGSVEQGEYHEPPWF